MIDHNSEKFRVLLSLGLIIMIGIMEVREMMRSGKKRVGAPRKPYKVSLIKGGAKRLYCRLASSAVF